MTRRGMSRGLATLTAVAVVTAPLALGLSAASPAAADEPKGTAMVLVLDASGSMKESDGHGSTKLAAARAAVRTIVGQLPSDVQVGLMVYGNTVASAPDHAKACRDIHLVVPVAPLDRTALNAAVDAITAKGETPIGASLQQAAAALPKGSSGSIVLVSDGEDSCAPPAPCTVAKQLDAGGVQLTVDTVGLKVDATARTELTCISRATGGTYTDVQDTAQLADKLGAVTQQAARPRRAVAGGNRVEGAATITDAPPLVDGRYTDSVVLDEKLYWKVGLTPGTTTTVRVTADATGVKAKASSFGGEMHIDLVNDTGGLLDGAYENEMLGKTSVKGVSTKLRADEDPSSAYVAVSLAGWAKGTEIPLTIDVQGAAGGAGASASPSASPSDAASASPSATAGGALAQPSATAAGSSPSGPSSPTAAATPADGGYSLVVLLATAGGVGLAGLVAGLFLGRLLGRRAGERSGGTGVSGGPGTGPGVPYGSPLPGYGGEPGVPQYGGTATTQPASTYPPAPTYAPTGSPGAAQPVAGFRPQPYPSQPYPPRDGTTLPPPPYS